MGTKNEMKKFVVGDRIYLREPSDEQLEAVLAWMQETAKLNILTSTECLAVFTPSGKGKQRPAVAIQYASAIADGNAIAAMEAAYPSPKSLAGITQVAEPEPEPELKQPEPGEIRQTLGEADALPAHALTKEEKLEMINQENLIGGEPELSMDDYHPELAHPGF